jgi:8-oxo-dGTP pyrophosphatase MutT (NUDIX family)
MIEPFDPSLPYRLAHQLAQGPRLPVSSRRHRAVASMGYGRHAGPPRHDAKMAAVLVLLYPHQGRWHLPMTVRQGHLPTHAGQVSFPGGGVDEGETPAAAALREAQEELGIDPASCELLGPMSPLYIFHSNYDVRPWLAHTSARPAFEPNDAEVARLLELPLDPLPAYDTSGTMTIQRGALRFEAPCLPCGDTRLWGASLMILGELVELLREIQREDHREGAPGK